MTQNVMERVMRKVEGIEKRRKNLQEALKKEEKEIKCVKCGMRGAVEFSITTTSSNNLEIRTEEKEIQLCHSCIRELLEHPTKPLKTTSLEISPTPEKKVPKKEPLEKEKLEWKEKAEEKRKKLLKMSKGEIAKEYGISKGYVNIVNRALQKECFEVLTNPEMSTSEKAKELDISENSVSLELTALKKIGITIGEDQK